MFGYCILLFELMRFSYSLAVQHYYAEMSALGDVPIEEYEESQLSSKRRINNVAIPFCVLHALDDPLVTWRTVAGNEGLMHPKNLTKTGSGNLVLLLTKGGGHVGWCVADCRLNHVSLRESTAHYHFVSCFDTGR